MTSKAVLEMVDDEVEAAYADTHQQWSQAAKRRNLNFKASAWLTRDEAISILEEWVMEYNCFEPAFLKKLPENAMVLIAREGSVCIYVKGCEVSKEMADTMGADECFEAEDGSTRLWWD